MTKTPKTDAAEQKQNILNQSITDKNWPWEAIKSGYNFARQLEEENAELKTILEQCRLFVSITPHDSAFFDRICQALAK